MTVLSAMLSLMAPAGAQASVLFPYSQRLRDYSPWTPATRGDINTIGMAGATVAVPSSIAAVEANSAGFAMQTQSVSAQFNKTTHHDERLQRSGEPIDSIQGGLGVSPPPWGFGVSYYSPMTESGNYISQATNRSVDTEISLKQFRFSLARGFLENKLALGASLDLVKAVREIGGYAYNTLGLSYRVGALYRLPRHVVLGLSYSPEFSARPASSFAEQFDLPGFNRAIVMPAQMSWGAGWVPNRFFKIGASVTRVSQTKNTALLADQSIATGEKTSYIPRLGTSYVLAEYRNLKIEWAAGAYYEPSRIVDQPSRFHATTGLEVNPYFINLGAGFDLADGYRNVMLSAGIDLVRTLRTFDIIPPDPVPPLNKFLPNAARVSADGLPDGLTEGERKRYRAPAVDDVGKIIQAIPGKIRDKFKRR